MNKKITFNPHKKKAYFSLDNHQGTLINLMEKFQMYEFTKKFVSNKRVLDLGCNVGRGLGILSETSKQIVGLDINEEAVKIAKKNYRFNKKIKLLNGDIEKIDFSIGKFDIILIFQTIYLVNVEKAIRNIKKLLNKNGQIIILSINPDRPDFNPAIYARKYHKIDELVNLLKKHGFKSFIYGSIHDDDMIYRGKLNKFIKIIRIIFSKIKIIPKNYKIKKILKRVFYGKLLNIPNDIRDVKNIKFIEPKILNDKNLYKNYISYYLVSKLN